MIDTRFRVATVRIGVLRWLNLALLAGCDKPSHCPFAAMASDGLVIATETPLPELMFNVYTLDGFSCSVVATATLTVWDPKSEEGVGNRAVGIGHREWRLRF